jgi:hypothetical protein
METVSKKSINAAFLLSYQYVIKTQLVSMFRQFLPLFKEIYRGDELGV